MRKKYLITGGAGFIGAHLAKKLSKNTNDIVLPLKKDTDTWRFKKLNLQNVIKVNTNLLDYESVYRLLKKHKPDHIIHLATRGVYPEQWNDRTGIITGNYQMAANLLEATFQLKDTFKLSSFINTGSVFEYGTLKGKVAENNNNFDDNINLYSASKKATTILADAYKEFFEVCTLRLFTAYGPLGADTRFIEGTINRCISGKESSYAPNVIRDFIYIDDIVSAIEKATTRKIPSGEIINIGSGKKYNLDEVSKLIKKLTKSKSKLTEDPSFIRKNESKCWADIAKAKNLLNWKPKYSLEKGLSATIKQLTE